MFEIETYKKKLVEKIGEKRYRHSLRVYETALEINKNFNIDVQKIKEASILHDCAKYNEDYYYNKYKEEFKLDENLINNKAVLHAFLGFVVAKKEYNIIDIDVLNAIKYHTTGRENMTNLEKIIFIADAIEPERNYENVDELRRLAKIDIDKCILFSLNETIKLLIRKNQPIYTLTVDARNYLLKEKNE